MAGLTGGGRLDAYLRDIAERVGDPQEVRVGFLEGSQESSGVSMPMVAAIQEFGAPKAGIPPRPFFRGMITKHKDEWAPELGKVLVIEDYDAEASLGRMGQRIAAELVQSIRETDEPPLSPVTLMLRKMRDKNPDLVIGGKIVAEAAARVAAGESTAGVSTKPLIDTGDMWKGVASEVRKTE